MKHRPLLLSAWLLCAWPAFAQVEPFAEPAPKPVEKPALVNGLPFPLVSLAEAVPLLESRPLIFHLQNETLQTALDELQKQSGVAFDLRRADNNALAKTLTLELETSSFDRALREIADEAGVKIGLRRMGVGGLWQVGFGPNARDENLGAPQAGQAPFEVRLLSLVADVYKTVTPNQDDPQGKASPRQNADLTIEFEGVPSPQLMSPRAPHIRLTRAEDDRGNSLVAPSGTRFPVADRSMSSVIIKLPSGDAQTLAHLEGVAQISFCTKRERWELPYFVNVAEIANSTHEFQSNGETMRLTVKSARRLEAGIELELVLMGEIKSASSELPHPLLWIDAFLETLRLEDSQGRIFRADGQMPGLNRTLGGAFISVRAPFVPLEAQAEPDPRTGPKPLPPNEPFKLIFDAPVEWAQTEVPFAFENVPLP